MDARVQLLLNEGQATLATVTQENKPEAAAILFATDDHFNFYFETNPSYRKANNLANNPNAALVVTKSPYSIQVEGAVSFLAGKEAEKARRLLLKKNPTIKKWLDNKEQLLLKLTPNWVRLRDSERDEFVQII